MNTLRAFVAAVITIDLVAAAAVWAQAPREQVNYEMVAKIVEQGQKHSQVMETISYLTDVHGPRLTGSPMARRAADWTCQRLTEWGLEQVQLESWGPFGRGWSLESYTVNLVEPTFTPLIAYPKAWSPSMQMKVRGEPIFLDAKTEQELEEFRGKLHRAIVLISPPREVKALFEPLAQRRTDEGLLKLANESGISSRRIRSSSSSRASTSSAAASARSNANARAAAARSSNGEAPPSPTSRRPATSNPRTALQLQSDKWRLVYEEGAAVVLEPGRGDGGTVFVGSATLPRTRTSSSSNNNRSRSQSRSSRRPRPWTADVAVVPQFVVAVEHYNRIVRMLQKKANPQLEVDLFCNYHTDDLDSFNIVAEIPGSDLKHEIVMLGAHFDSWHAGTGATDNAIGCGVALEAVRILQAIGAKPRRTIRIALWTGEEQGLLGSRAYVGKHFGRVVTPSREQPTRLAASDSKPAASAAAAANGRTDPGAGSRSSSDQTAATTEPSANTSRSSRRQRPPNTYELKPDHQNFSSYFNLDNGTGKIRGIYLQNNEQLRPIFRAWLSPFEEMGASTVSLSNTSGTDHLSFDAIGLPGFQFIQDPIEYRTRTHHSSMDVFDRVQAEDARQASIIMATFVYHAAMRDEKLPRKAINGKIVSAPEASSQTDGQRATKTGS